jgi:hypothetical protein
VKSSTTNANLVNGLPREFTTILNHLHSLSFASEPDYKLLLMLLRKALQESGAGENTPFDWERKVFIIIIIVVLCLF